MPLTDFIDLWPLLNKMPSIHAAARTWEQVLRQYISTTYRASGRGIMLDVNQLRNINVKSKIAFKFIGDAMLANTAVPLTLVPRLLHPAPKPLGLYFRIGRNDHREVLELVTSGETRFFGIVCDPTNVRFQKELLERTAARRLDVVLDPRTQASATIGGFNESLGALPWGRGRPHRDDDFQGASGRRVVSTLARFAFENGITQILTPSHLLRSAADDWLDIDRQVTLDLRNELNRIGGEHISLLYSLAITYAMLRDPAERRALARTLKNLPVDGVWLAVDGVGSQSTPAAVRTYLDAVLEFHRLELPLVADHAGGVVGLAFLAFGGVGGLAHGITHGERFDTSHWRQPRANKPFGLSRRIYVPALDMLLKPEEARMLFDLGARPKALFACHDTECCPRSLVDMLANPARHFMRQRIDEVTRISSVPADLRPTRFVDRHLRSTTDQILTASRLHWPDPTIAGRMEAQRKRLDRMRESLGRLSQEPADERSMALVPPRSVERGGRQQPPVAS